MYCSKEREIAFNILCFSSKMVFTVLETISKSLHVCAFDFSCLSNAFIYYFGVDSKALFLVSCICRHGCHPMSIENESKNEDLDLGSVRHIDRDKNDTVKTEVGSLALKT